MKYLLSITLLATVLNSCKIQTDADLMLYNVTIYTVDSAFSTAEAMVITDGKIVETGSFLDLDSKYNCSEKIDAGGKFIYPGFIDAHAHFVNYALGLQKLDLTGTKSWQQVLEKLKQYAAQHPDGWIEGFGWDQNDWESKMFPANDSLNKWFPERPIFLSRIDGHAAIVNAKVFEIAGVKPGNKINGGLYEVKRGRLTGLVLDNAKSFIESIIPPANKTQLQQALQRAQQRCFAVGLTTIDDCGLDYETVEIIKDLQKDSLLQMRLYILLSDDKKNYDYLKTKGKIKTDFLDVRGFKVYADGALGSRGACMLQDYTDKPVWKGFLLNSMGHFDSVANIIHANGWQMCTHAIGDSANRSVLKIYAKYLQGKNDLRWRIEHAQVIDSADFHFFKDYNIIPSIQPTHATSDMYWAAARLGSERIHYAYAYKKLLLQNNWLPLGTDFPIEDISPLKTFYAAVVRKDASGFPQQGFQKENALNRVQALMGMTRWAAKANFEEHEKGSLEAGKFADFVILDRDIMNVGEEALLSAQVLKTYLGGKLVYKR